MTVYKCVLNTLSLDQSERCQIDPFLACEMLPSGHSNRIKHR